MDVSGIHEMPSGKDNKRPQSQASLVVAMESIPTSVIPVPVTGIQCAVSTARKTVPQREQNSSPTAQTRRGWIPVTSTGMTEARMSR
jgi:hypothetical protein